MSSLLQPDKHYTYRAEATHLSVITESAAYFRVLHDVFSRAAHHILIVGWAFDDRVPLIRKNDSTTSGDDPGVGDLLVSLAEENSELQIEICIWRSPTVFSGDQHISKRFQAALTRLENLTLHWIPAESTLASRHEKYVVVDDCLAFLGGIDISHNRWDTSDHHAVDDRRVNPDGQPYSPYHDTQAVFVGPVVRELLSLANRELPLRDLPDNAGANRPGGPSIWPRELPVDARNVPIMLALTRYYAASGVTDVHQICEVYCRLIESAQRYVYIENQYFSSDVVTRAIRDQLEREEGPEILIVMPRSLPDAVGRLTMGVNSSMHISQLIESDRFGRLGFFCPVAPDDPAVSIKVHSKTMIVDDRYLTLGSANISRRSFSMDGEANLVVDGLESADQQCVGDLANRILAHHSGVAVGEWRERLDRAGGSRLAVLNERSTEWDGLVKGDRSLPSDVLPKAVLQAADPEQPPPQETVLHRIAQSSPRDVLAWTKKTWIMAVVVTAALAGVFFLARSDFDVEMVLSRIDRINDARPILAGVLTVVTYWLSMVTLVTIVVPIVFFAALHGPWWGIIYSVAGLFSGTAIFYGIGLVLHNSSWPDRYAVVRKAREQLERIKPYGMWAVAISRMLPSGPFMVVNLMTGIVGFTPGQVLVGSIIGLGPGIVAFSFFGNIIRQTFTDPSWTNTFWFIGFFVIYFIVVRGIMALVQRASGWVREE